jgi:hypothetical protein
MRDAFEKLAHYEETGLEPEQIYEMDLMYRKKCEELAGKWIPTSERLPNEQDIDAHEGVFVAMIEGAVSSTHLYFRGGIWFDEDGNYYKVLAWMPLPEPYRGEADE